jgi:hypothetical protein
VRSALALALGRLSDLALFAVSAGLKVQKPDALQEDHLSFHAPDHFSSYH